MKEYMTLTDFVAKIEWEGGIEGALEYGLKHTDLDPGDESAAELCAKWRELEDAYEDLEILVRQVGDLLDDCQSEDQEVEA